MLVGGSINLQQGFSAFMLVVIKYVKHILFSLFFSFMKGVNCHNMKSNNVRAFSVHKCSRKTFVNVALSSAHLLNFTQTHSLSL